MRRIAAKVTAIILFLSVPALAGIEASPPRWDAGIRSVDAFLPLATWKKQFEITEGKDRGTIVPLSLQRAAAAGGHWNLRFGDYGAILIQDTSRGLVVERLDLIKSGSYIVYEPALPILAAETPDYNVPREANFKMFDAKTGKLKRSGRVTHQVKEVAPWRFETPAGPIDGYYVLIEHRLAMRYAELDMALGLGFRLDEGPIFGSGRYTLTKLGIFKEKKIAAAALAAASSSTAH